MTLRRYIPSSWEKVLFDEFDKPYFKELEAFLEEEWLTQTIFPPKENIFSALELTPFDSVKVLLLGQDPYHDDGQAHGLCFSVMPGVKHPPSLKNIFKELNEDLGEDIPQDGYLSSWAEQGILMINTVLTVRAHQANSHKKQGWEKFTDAVICAVNEKETPVIFVLWGGPAQKKASLINTDKHHIVSSAHPSPLSSYRGFFGSRPFSKINKFLEDSNHAPIDWSIKDQTPSQPSLF